MRNKLRNRLILLAMLISATLQGAAGVHRPSAPVQTPELIACSARYAGVQAALHQAYLDSGDLAQLLVIGNLLDTFDDVRGWLVSDPSVAPTVLCTQAQFHSLDALLGSLRAHGMLMTQEERTALAIAASLKQFEHATHELDGLK